MTTRNDNPAHPPSEWVRDPGKGQNKGERSQNTDLYVEQWELSRDWLNVMGGELNAFSWNPTASTAKLTITPETHNVFFHHSLTKIPEGVECTQERLCEQMKPAGGKNMDEIQTEVTVILDSMQTVIHSVWDASSSPPPQPPLLSRFVSSNHFSDKM